MRFKPSYKQLTIDGFRSSLEGLDKTNRWVWLGDHLPWDEYEKLYGQTLNNQTAGASAKPARMVIGAMIVKHITRLSDQDTIEMIQENPYMQYLCGLGEFTDQPIFDSSLFVELRKRISDDDINKMTEALLKREQQMKEDMRKHKEDEARNRGEEPPAAHAVDENASAFTDSKGREHKGVLKIDATCADAEVRYPVDVDIIDDGCRVIDRFIRRICKADSISVPYTYYGKARNAYRYLVKMKKKGGKLVKDTIEQMLSCLHRDILTLIDLTAGEFRYRLDCLRKDQRRILDATMKMYFQQEQMFRTGEHRCKDRIVSIFQPHVRPIVRGKASANVEFGAKKCHGGKILFVNMVLSIHVHPVQERICLCCIGECFADSFVFRKDYLQLITPSDDTKSVRCLFAMSRFACIMNILLFYYYLLLFLSMVGGYLPICSLQIYNFCLT